MRHPVGPAYKEVIFRAADQAEACALLGSLCPFWVGSILVFTGLAVLAKHDQHFYETGQGEQNENQSCHPPDTEKGAEAVRVGTDSRGRGNKLNAED